MKIPIIILLILLNLFMLYTNIKRHNQLNILTKQLMECEQNSRLSSSKWKKPRLPEYLIRGNSKLLLITFFSDGGCAPCIREEIEFINELYTKYNSFINIYLIGDNNINLTSFGANFDYEVIAEQGELYKLRVENPVSILIDRNRTIQFIHYAEPGNSEKSRSFYNRVRSLFESVYSEK